MNNGAAIFSWSKEYIIQILTSGNNPQVTNPNLIAALKLIDRRDFVSNEFKAKAYQDISIPIGYDENLSSPIMTIQMINAINPKFGGKYLDIGTGSGWVAAILGSVAGATGEVYSVERVQWIWELARKNINQYKDKIGKLQVLYRDGLDGLPEQAPFDGIHIAFAIDDLPETLKLQLKDGGKLVYPTTDHHLKIIERHSVNEFSEEIIPGFVLDKGKSGKA